jgi:pteridine reductase
MTPLLQGKIALVTGGAHRLGRAIALGLAAAGANLSIHYHQSSEKAEQTLADLRALGVEAHGIQGNLSDTAACERVVDEALARWSQLDILVNNAGIWGPTPLGQTTAERWDELFDTNLRSMYFVTQRAAPALRAARGVVINIADVGALKLWANHAAYLATKGGVVTLIGALAKDLAPEVRVNAIAPGPVLLPETWNESKNAATIKSTLLKRLGSPEDIGQAAVFLATAGYITGVILPVDGGQRLV